MTRSEMSQAQRLRICRTLLAQADLGHLWSASGPTPEAKRARATRDVVPPTEQVVLDVAFAVWEERGGPTVADLLGLATHHREVVASLLLAWPDEIRLEAWVRQHGWLEFR